MTARRGGLGRGLGALIPTAPEPTVTPGTDPVESAAKSTTATAGATSSATTASDDVRVVIAPDIAPAAVTVVPSPKDTGASEATLSATYQEIPHAQIRPNPRQPRTVFDEDALDELVSSLREVGLLQPVVVRPLPEPTEDGVCFELVMGERRWRAAGVAGLDPVPAIVRTTGDDAMLRDALLENLHRSELNPLEEAAAYAQLLEDFQVTHEELAARIGRSRSQVTNTMRLLGLSAPVQRRVAAGVLSAGHARALLGLSTASAQDALATRIVAEGLSVRAVEELVALDRGEEPARSPRRRPQAQDPDVLAAADALAEQVADLLDTRVRAELGRARCRLVVEAADLEDLARITALIVQR